MDKNALQYFITVSDLNRLKSYTKNQGKDTDELILWRYCVRGTGTVWRKIAVYDVALAKR